MIIIIENIIIRNQNHLRFEMKIFGNFIIEKINNFKNIFRNVSETDFNETLHKCQSGPKEQPGTVLKRFIDFRIEIETSFVADKKHRIQFSEIFMRIWEP